MYDKTPYIQVSAQDSDCIQGWRAIAEAIRNSIPAEAGLVCIECYPGVFVDEISVSLHKELSTHRQLFAEDWYLSPDQINKLVEPYLSDDPVFGRMNSLSIRDFIDTERIEISRAELSSSVMGLTIVMGTGASLLTPKFDLLIYADM